MSKFELCDCHSFDQQTSDCFVDMPSLRFHNKTTVEGSNLINAVTH